MIRQHEAFEAGKKYIEEHPMGFKVNKHGVFVLKSWRI